MRLPAKKKGALHATRFSSNRSLQCPDLRIVVTMTSVATHGDNEFLSGFLSYRCEEKCH
jgi:hypothetical protein